MLHQLQEARRRGVPIITFNPLRETGLLHFANPQSPAEMLTGAETTISTHYLQVRAGGDSAAMLVFEFLNEIGFSTGDLEAAEFKPVVVRLLAALDLRVASPDRLEVERDMIAQQDLIEADHVARLRRQLRNLNGCEVESELPF